MQAKADQNRSALFLKEEIPIRPFTSCMTDQHVLHFTQKCIGSPLSMSCLSQLDVSDSTQIFQKLKAFDFEM